MWFLHGVLSTNIYITRDQGEHYTIAACGHERKDT